MTRSGAARRFAAPTLDWLADVHAQRRALKIDYVKERSSQWSRSRIRHLVSRPLSNANLLKVETRRRQLSQLPPHRLHPSYCGIKPNAGSFKVTPDSISISPIYGHVLYSFVAALKPALIIESGSGLGLSGMYICCAARRSPGSRFLSFEIADYHSVAQESVDLIAADARVVHGDFHGFGAYLEPHETISFAFLDGKHTPDELIKSFDALLGRLARGAVVIVDDVSYSDDAAGSWSELVRDQSVGFAAVVNQRLGVLVR